MAPREKAESIKKKGESRKFCLSVDLGRYPELRDFTENHEGYGHDSKGSLVIQALKNYKEEIEGKRHIYLDSRINKIVDGKANNNDEQKWRSTEISRGIASSLSDLRYKYNLSFEQIKQFFHEIFTMVVLREQFNCGDDQTRRSVTLELGQEIASRFGIAAEEIYLTPEMAEGILNSFDTEED